MRPANATELLRESQSAALERLAQGATLDEVLDTLVGTFERQCAGRYVGGYALLDESAARFIRSGGHGMPASYHQAVEGMEVVSRTGSCCLAVLERREVVIADVTADAQWQRFAAFIAPLGLRAAWSAPIVGSRGEILGTFAHYAREPGEPGAQEREFLRGIAETAALAIERKRAEEALRASEARYRSLLGLMPAAVYTCEADGRISYYNDLAAKLWGRAPPAGESDERFCGSLRLWRTDGSPLPHAETPMARALGEGEAFRNQEVVIERPDGTRITVLVNIDPLRDAHGRVSGAINVFHDISERRRGDDALRASEARYRALVESQSEMLCRFRPDGTILFANGAYARARGTTPEALVGRNFWDFIPQSDHAGVRAMLAALTPEAPEARVENRFESEAGTRWTLWTNRALAFDAAGRLTEAQSLGIDITDRRRAEEAMREEARRLELLNRVGKTLAGELDLEKTVQAVTDAATELSGAQFGAFFYNVKNDAGESYLLYTLSGARREDFARFGVPRNTALFGPTFSGEGVVRLDDVTRDPRFGRNAPHHGLPKGHLPVRSYLAVPVVSRTGEVIGGLFFGHPQPGVFTERAEHLVSGIAGQAAVAMDNARLYAQSRRLVNELREADRRKDEFIATLSHELRNPLAPLASALDILRLPGAAADTASVHAMMERQVRHLVRLTDDLLEMSRITRGTFELRRERTPLAAVLRNALETADPLIRAAGHRVSLALPEQPLWLDGDPVRLAQIFANLVNNAAKYTPKGGTIALQAQREGMDVVVRVRDDGAGFTPEELARAFDMFSRGADSTGLGIGLALARRLADMHGGAIQAASAGRGKGAEFTVRLPLAAPHADAAQPAAPAPALSHKRILVVDDNRDAADSLAVVLRHLGADVRVAHSGQGALAAFDAYGPHAVLLDIGMPGMDGYAVARVIRSRGGARVSLVALTGWGQEEDRRRAREAGFDGHLVKPADIGALQSLLGSLGERAAT